jgi:hypothetical protein
MKQIWLPRQQTPAALMRVAGIVYLKHHSEKSTKRDHRISFINSYKLGVWSLLSSKNTLLNQAEMKWHMV